MVYQRAGLHLDQIETVWDLCELNYDLSFETPKCLREFIILFRSRTYLCMKWNMNCAFRRLGVWRRLAVWEPMILFRFSIYVFLRNIFPLWRILCDLIAKQSRSGSRTGCVSGLVGLLLEKQIGSDFFWSLSSQVLIFFALGSPDFIKIILFYSSIILVRDPAVITVIYLAKLMILFRSKTYLL